MRKSYGRQPDSGNPTVRDENGGRRKRGDARACDLSKHYESFFLSVEHDGLILQLSGEQNKTKLMAIGDRRFLIEGDMSVEFFFPKEDNMTVEVCHLDGFKETVKKQS